MPTIDKLYPDTKPANDPYTSDWVQAKIDAFLKKGGQIIDRELISIEQEDGQWTAVDYRGKSRHTGPTALIAAMRCYVQSKLADEVEIPEELL